MSVLDTALFASLAFKLQMVPSMPDSPEGWIIGNTVGNSLPKPWLPPQLCAASRRSAKEPLGACVREGLERGR